MDKKRPNDQSVTKCKNTTNMLKGTKIYDEKLRRDLVFVVHTV